MAMKVGTRVQECRVQCMASQSLGGCPGVKLHIDVSGRLVISPVRGIKENPPGVVAEMSVDGVKSTPKAVCKHWIRNEYIRNRLGCMVKAGKTTMKDVEFLGHLCAEGSIDPVKRDFRAMLRDDGMLVTYNSAAGDGVQSCVYCSDRNPNVVLMFHFERPVSMKKTGLIRQSVRQFLDRVVPGWNHMRSTPAEKVQSFLVQKSGGENSFFHIEKGVAVQTPNCGRVEVRFRDKDVALIGDELLEKGHASWVGSGGEVITFQRCVVHDMPAFSIIMSKEGSQPIRKEMIVSHGLHSVVLERNHVAPTGVMYVHGLRSLVKAVTASLPLRDPLVVRVSSSYLDLDMAKRVIKGMGLKTNRPIGKDPRFKAFADTLGISYVAGEPMKRRMFSAFGYNRGAQIVGGMGVSNGHRDLLVSKGLFDEQVDDILLAAHAVVADAGRGVRLLNSMGCTRVLDAEIPVAEAWDADLQLCMGGSDVMLYTVDAAEVVPLLGDRVKALREREALQQDRAVVLARNGRVFALYCDPLIRPASPLREDMREDFVSHAGSQLQEASGRLCYIVAACRAHPELRDYERSLRAMWFMTEARRPEWRGNVHDIAVLSMMAKDCSGSAHYSSLPYV